MVCFELTARRRSKTGASRKRSPDAVEIDNVSGAGKTSESNNTNGSKAKNTKTDERDTHDVKDFHLDGEEDECVQCSTPVPAYVARFSAQEFHTFKKGAKSMQGSEKDIFYGANDYFEKLRIKQGKKKSKKRDEMERIWSPNGVSREQNDRLVLFRGERAFFDQYGRLEINGRTITH